MQYRERDADSATRKLPFLPSVSTCRHRGSGDDVTFADTVLLLKKSKYRSSVDEENRTEAAEAAEATRQGQNKEIRK